MKKWAIQMLFQKKIWGLAHIFLIENQYVRRRMFFFEKEIHNCACE